MISNKKKRLGGFTLIELLVVVAIIGILASVVLASLNGARYKARNVQRNSDVKQIVNAFNLGLNNSNSLPPAAGWACVSTTCSSFLENSTVDAFLSPYITKPTDPAGGTKAVTGYIYRNPADLGNLTLFPIGAYLMWYVEVPLNSASCGMGIVRNVGATEINCAYKLD